MNEYSFRSYSMRENASKDRIPIPYVYDINELQAYKLSTLDTPALLL